MINSQTLTSWLIHTVIYNSMISSVTVFAVSSAFFYRANEQDTVNSEQNTWGGNILIWTYNRQRVCVLFYSRTFPFLPFLLDYCFNQSCNSSCCVFSHRLYVTLAWTQNSTDIHTFIYTDNTHTQIFSCKHTYNQHLLEWYSINEQWRLCPTETP